MEAEAAPVSKKRKAEDDNNNKSKTPAKKGKESASVFIGGLSFSTEESSLKSFLTSNGLKPSSVRIISRDGQSKGFGYADFDSKEEAKKCIELTGSELDGRSIRCDNADSKPTTPGSGRGGSARGGRGSDRGRGGFGSGGRGGGNFDNDTPTKLLMIKNLSFHTDNDSLASAFSEANDARVVKDRETGKSRGFAFVEYNDVESATKAKNAMNQKDLDGRNINIVFAAPKESFGGGRGSDRGRGGRGGRGGSRGRGSPSVGNKGSIQKFEGSKLTFNDDSE